MSLLKCWRDLFPPASAWTPRENIEHRRSRNSLKLVTHISELVYKALQLLRERLVYIWQVPEKVMFCVWCTLHISAPLRQQQANVSLNYESLEKRFECFSYLITAEIESGVMGKAYAERLPFSNFSFSAEKQCQKSLTFMLQSLVKCAKIKYLCK